MARSKLMPDLTAFLAKAQMPNHEKLFVYLFNASTMTEQGRFSFPKHAKMMESLGWRSLDTVDEALTVLFRSGHVVEGTGPDPFKKDGSTVKGYYVLAVPAPGGSPRPATAPANGPTPVPQPSPDTASPRAEPPSATARPLGEINPRKKEPTDDELIATAKAAIAKAKAARESGKPTPLPDTGPASASRTATESRPAVEQNAAAVRAEPEQPSRPGFVPELGHMMEKRLESLLQYRYKENPLTAEALMSSLRAEFPGYDDCIEAAVMHHLRKYFKFVVQVPGGSPPEYVFYCKKEFGEQHKAGVTRWAFGQARPPPTVAVE